MIDSLLERIGSRIITSISEYAKIVHKPWHRTSVEVRKVIEKLFFLHDFVDVFFLDDNNGDYRYEVVPDPDPNSGMTFEQVGEKLKKLQYTKLHGLEDTVVFKVEIKSDHYLVTYLDPYNM